MHGRMVDEILSGDPDELPIALAPEPATRCRSSCPTRPASCRTICDSVRCNMEFRLARDQNRVHNACVNEGRHSR